MVNDGTAVDKPTPRRTGRQATAAQPFFRAFFLLALAALARFIGVRWVLVVAANAVLGMDVAAFVAARSSSSSTAGVSVLLVPILSLVTVVPAAALLGRAVRSPR
jgi:hypothetical protein